MPRSSAEGKRLYNIAERDAYHAFLSHMRDIDPHYKIAGGQKGFRRLMKEHGWKVPHHYSKAPKSAKTLEAEQKFVEEGLGRSGAYTRHRYPEATDFEDSG